MRSSISTWALLLFSNLIYAQLSPRQADGTDVGPGIMGYDADPSNEDPVETDSGCKAAGSGNYCNPSHPGGGLIRGRCCHGKMGGPEYIYCHVYGKKRSKFRKAICRRGECIQVDPFYVVCGETS